MSSFQDYTIVLAAGVEQARRFTGFSSFTILDATSQVSVRADDGSYQNGLVAGDGFDEVKFETLAFLSAVAQTIRVRFSRGYQRTGQTVNVNASATVSVANSNKALADVTIAAGNTLQVAGANANRKAVVIKSRSVNTDNVRLGNAVTVGAAAGNELEPGESATYETEGAVYAHNPGATSVTLTVTELEKL